MKRVAMSLFLGLAMAAASVAQDDAKSDAERRFREEQRQQEHTGAVRVSKDAETVKAAARYAVSAQSAAIGADMTLSSIEDVEGRLVVGVSYQLSITVLKDGKPLSARTVVLRRSDGTYRLINWIWK